MRNHLPGIEGRKHQKVGGYREWRRIGLGKAEGSLTTLKGRPFGGLQKPGLTQRAQQVSTLRLHHWGAAQLLRRSPFKLLAAGAPKPRPLHVRKEARSSSRDGFKEDEDQLAKGMPLQLEM